MKLALLVLVLAVLCESSYAQNCSLDDPDDNANYEEIGGHCAEVNMTVNVSCEYRKTCNTGYESPSHNSLFTCVENVTASPPYGYWDPPDDEECTACTDPNYGTNCFLTIPSPCSSACVYDTVKGCKMSEGGDTKVSCYVGDVNVTVTRKLLYGIIGAQSNVTIEAFVNLPANDVTVKAIFGTESIDMKQINDTYYELDVAVERESMGDYKIEAVTKANSSYSSSEIVTVYITDPVNITRVFDAREEANETEVSGPVKELLLKGNDTIEWTCEASGIPIPEVRWYFQGAEVGNYPIGDRIYQVIDHQNMTSTLYIHPDVDLSKSDSGVYACSARNYDYTGYANFTKTVALELVVLEGPVDVPVYATREDFLIAVIVLGIVLFLTIVAFAGFAIWMTKSGSELQSTQAKKYTHPNDYTNPAFNNIQPEPQQAPAPADDVGSRMLNRPKPSLPKSKQKKIPQTQFEHGPPAPRTLASPPRQSVITQPKTTPTFQLPGNYVEPGRSTFPQYTSRPTSPSSPGLAQNDVNDIYDEPYNAPPQTPQRNAPIEEDVYEEPAGDQLYEETIEPPRRY